MGLATNQIYNVGTKKICIAKIPTIHGLSMLRDTNTFPISQSKQEAALFGPTFLWGVCY